MQRPRITLVRYDEVVGHGKCRAQEQNFFSDLFDYRLIVNIFSHFIYEEGNLLGLRLLHSAVVMAGVPIRNPLGLDGWAGSEGVVL